MKRKTAQSILADNVTALLEAQGSTFAALGPRLGWNEDRLEDLAKGTLDARLDEIDALALALNALPADLMCDLAATQPKFEYTR